jgi:phage shock protein A
MKPFIYWLFGERAGRTFVALWHWLWGLPIESGGKIAVEVAQESLASMQQSVHEFTTSVAKITASYQRAQEKYNLKQKEYQVAEAQAKLAYRNGNTEAAHLAMGKAITIEKLLPKLAEQVAQAEKILQTHKEQLNRERQRLETYKVEMQNLKDLAEVNEALAAIAKVNNTLQMDSARSQFDQATSAIQGCYLQTNALAELVQNPAEKLTADLEKMTLEDEISQRLQQFNLDPPT